MVTLSEIFPDGQTFHPPSVPVLLQILSGAHSAQDLLPNGLVYTLPSNKVIQLTLPAGAVSGIGGPVCYQFYQSYIQGIDFPLASLPPPRPHICSRPQRR
jgi:hypothetical protein